MKTFSFRHLLLIAGGIIGLAFLAMPTFAQDAKKMQELQRVIDAQQKQMEAQQKQLDAQRQLLQDLQKQMESLVKDADTEAVPAAAEKPTAKPEVASTKPPPPVEKVVTSGGGKRIKLAISGQVNRAVNIVDDGKDTDAYFVDNDNSESRVRFDGTAKATDDLTLASRIELTIAPNLAGQVNQNNQETNNIFDQRWTEVSLDSKRFGKLSLGKGATASYGSGSVDLSGTAVISYATICGYCRGHVVIWRESDTGDNFTDMSGSLMPSIASMALSRRDRLRYDSPRFGGFQLAASAVSDDRYDAGSVRWGGQGYGFKAGRLARQSPIPTRTTPIFQYNGSFSLLHEDTGLNLTLSAGRLDRDKPGQCPKTISPRLGWITKILSPWGTRRFGVDYTRSLNLPTDSDDGYSVGVAAVQQFDQYGTGTFSVSIDFTLSIGISSPASRTSTFDR